LNLSNELDNFFNLWYKEFVETLKWDKVEYDFRKFNILIEIEGDFLMGIKELIKKDIDNLRVDELIIISEQIKLLKKTKPSCIRAISLEEIRQMTKTSKSTWSEDVIKDRQERG